MRWILLLIGGTLLGQTWPQTIDLGAPMEQYCSGGGTTVVAVPPGVDPTARYGNFACHIPVSINTPFVLTFNWVEQTVGGVNQRLFQVKVNDQVVFDNFDIFSVCGGFMVPCSRSVVVVPTTKTLDVVFITEKRNAICSSISYAPLLSTLASYGGLWSASAIPCNQNNNPGAPVSDCASAYLLVVAQPDGSVKKYVAAPATLEIASSAVWK